MVVDLLVQLGLDGLKQVLIDNGRLLTFEDFALERDLADIEAIAKQMRDITLALGARLPTIFASRDTLVNLGTAEANARFVNAFCKGARRSRLGRGPKRDGDRHDGC
jgi:hypothetical protein